MGSCPRGPFVGLCRENGCDFGIGETGALPDVRAGNGLQGDVGAVSAGRLESGIRARGARPRAGRMCTLRAVTRLGVVRLQEGQIRCSMGGNGLARPPTHRTRVPRAAQDRTDKSDDQRMSG